jgi:hypothetical protein
VNDQRAIRHGRFPTPASYYNKRSETGSCEKMLGQARAVINGC